jgi:hypothetical protein
MKLLVARLIAAIEYFVGVDLEGKLRRLSVLVWAVMFVSGAFFYAVAVTRIPPRDAATGAEPVPVWRVLFMRGRG